jgi:hypothetical protein
VAGTRAWAEAGAGASMLSKTERSSGVLIVPDIKNPPVALASAYRARRKKSIIRPA